MNQPFSGDISLTGSEDTTVRGAITAFDGDGLSRQILTYKKDQAKHGTASIDGQTGEWQYTPESNYWQWQLYWFTLVDDFGGAAFQKIGLELSPLTMQLLSLA